MMTMPEPPPALEYPASTEPPPPPPPVFGVPDVVPGLPLPPPPGPPDLVVPPLAGDDPPPPPYRDNVSPSDDVFRFILCCFLVQWWSVRNKEEGSSYFCFGLICIV